MLVTVTFVPLLHSFDETAAQTFVTMFTSSFYAILFLAAVNANAAVTGLQNATATASTSACAAFATSTALDPNVVDCFIALPENPLSATGLSTPFILQPPCSMAVDTQQAFAEAAVYDPTTGNISIYHPLVLDLGQQPAAPNVVPVLPSGAVVGIWFGFNGNTLQLLDTNGLDANSSPVLEGANCINGLPGLKGDIFGQVSWCNAEQWFTAANAGITAGLLTVPPLKNDKNGQICPTSSIHSNLWIRINQTTFPHNIFWLAMPRLRIQMPTARLWVREMLSIMARMKLFS